MKNEELSVELVSHSFACRFWLRGYCLSSDIVLKLIALYES